MTSRVCRMIHFVMALVSFSVSCAGEEDCPPKTSSAMFTSIKWSNGVCYFTIEGATGRANQMLTGGKWVFNVTTARQICSEQNATLPVFDNDEEHSFVSENYRHGLDDQDTVHQMALGLYKHMRNETVHQTWDDGSANRTFKGTSITAALEGSAYAVAILAGGGEIRVWQWHGSDKSWDAPVGVLCQRRDPQARRSNRPNMCDTPVDYFPEVYRNYSDQMDPEVVCHFLIIGSTGILHKKIGDKYFYDVDKARGLCQEYGATLPIILNYDACLSLRRQIYRLHPLERNQTYGAKFGWVILGLSQTAHADGYTYKWDDGAAVDYEEQWPTKYTKAAYSALGLSILPPWCHWTNVQPHELAHDLPRLTICQHQLTEHLALAQPRKNKISICAETSPREQVEGTAVLETACYFKISGVPNQAMSVSVARDRCAEFGGVLPVIKNKEENDFLASAFDSDKHLFKKQAILGLRQMNNPKQYQWIDGSPLSYAPQGWERREEHAHATVLMLKTKIWKNEEIVLVVPDETWIICKDLTVAPKVVPTPPIPKTSSRATSVTTAELPPTVAMPSIPPHGEPCDEENHATYTKAIWHKTDASHKCYFIIPGATYNLGRSPSFSIEEARKICAKHMATLPILFTRIEAEFVAKNFRPYDFDPDLVSKNDLVAGIALGMIVEPKRPSEHRYTWDGNISMNYKPQEWKQRGVFREQAAFSPYVYMHFYQHVAWETVLAPDSMYWSTAVLCERRLVPESDGVAPKYASISILILGGFWHKIWRH